ncbi:universal stress protein [Amorphoplanes auranticolor]|uniref:Universal stress protein n=1 Tax=Actinoplanes auranticolor TaxID=47988 RepID=A0A919SHM7_9ACTN|nr:universal stress protein [Actinoplanes auranticolor]
MVVGVDGSAGALAAVRWAGRYVADTGAALRLLSAASASGTASVILPVPVGVSNAGPPRRKRSREEALAAAAAEASRYAPQRDVSTRAASETAVPALLDASSEAGLLVLGTSDRGRMAATLLGSVTARVVAEAHCPVVLVRGDAGRSGSVVVAVDTSDSCGPALRFAFQVAAHRRCALFAVHAWQPPLMAAGAGSLAAAAAATRLVGDGLPAAARRSLAEAVAPWREAFPDVAVHERLLEGHPETAVAEQTHGAALVVVGSRGRAALTGLVLGSTSQALLDRADCPVAVVRQSEDVPAA